MKTIKHDYLMKVKNDSDGWSLINQMRKQAKACGSPYKLVLRGSKPKTPWGYRQSIPLDEAQEIRIYIRPKDVEGARKERQEEYLYLSKFHKENAIHKVKLKLEQIMTEL